MKRNKIRYQAKPKNYPPILLSGRVFLLYHEEAMAVPQKGDLCLIPSCEALHTVQQGRYESTGFVGFYRADIYDGKGWKPALIADFFPHREQYFGKRERPIDTFTLCEEMLSQKTGAVMRRTYREHYAPLAEDGDEEE